MTTEMPAIVIGAGCDTDLAIIRSLGRKGIPIISISSDKYNICKHSKYITQSIILEHPEKWNCNLVTLLLKNIDHWKGAILIPASDYALDFLAENKSKLSNYYIIAAPDTSIIETCINKKKTLNMAINANVPIPKTHFSVDLTYINKNKNTLEYPCLLKPCISHKFCDTLNEGKMFKIDNFDDLKSKLVTTSNHCLDMMITQLIHGNCKQLYTYYAYRTFDGEFLGEFILKKLIQFPPDFGIIVAGESIHSKEIQSIGRRIFNELSYDGLGAIEFKQDPIDGKYKLIEINARAGLGINLAIQSNVDFPWILYNDKGKLKLIKSELYLENLKIVFLRNYIIGFFRYFKYYKDNRIIRDYFKVLNGERIYNNYSLNDIKPFLYGLLSLQVKILKKLVNK